MIITVAGGGGAGRAFGVSLLDTAFADGLNWAPPLLLLHDNDDNDGVIVVFVVVVAVAVERTTTTVESI